MNRAASQTLEGPLGTLPCDLTPTPPRFWWLKRFLMSGVALVVLLVGLRLAWGWQVQRRIDALVARLRAEGGPVTVDDFDALRSLSDAEDNASVLYERAIVHVLGVSPSGVQLDELRWNALEELRDRLADAESLLSVNQAPLELMRRARSCPRARWLGSLRDCVADPQPFSVWAGGWHFIRLVDLAARRDFITGRFDEGLARLEDLLHFANVASEATHPALAWAAPYARSRALRLVEDVGPSLPREARVPLRSLMSRLLDAEAPRRARAQLCRRKRAIVLAADSLMEWANTIVGAGPVGIPERMSGWVLGPLCESERLRYVELLSVHAEAAMNPDFAAAQAAIEKSSPGRFAWGDSLVPSLRELRLRSTDQERRDYGAALRCVARQNMAAVALALRLYEFDHGAQPDRLDVLVLDHLASIPDDPYAPVGTPVRYVPEQPVPRLYCVGKEGADDFGIWSASRLEGFYTYDVVYSLAGALPKDPETLEQLKEQVRRLALERRGEHSGDFPAGEDDAHTEGGEQEP